ncbi:alanine racemase [Nocardioides mesophilus]|uniref:Alanine racemase n=1 Tax=Nocardioides mesophilus TaxID=433659 RepID=A0A7G9RHU3_9ACTN|nr:alanine racemase [Nocardioides mesophilus]
MATRLDRAVAGLPEPPPAPVAVVDLDAFDANAADLVRRAAGTPVRVATKSLRVPGLVTRALATPGFTGVLSYTLREALWLVHHGVSDDVLVGYPTVDEAALRELTVDDRARAAVTLMVDDVAHLDLVDRARVSGRPVRVALDVDAGLRWRTGPHLGLRRSPLREPADVVSLARAVLERPGFELAGVMTYEGQVAGVPDDGGDPARSTAVRAVKTASVRQLRRRRRELAAALHRLVGPDGPGLWNAGGTGSLETSAADPVVTEVSAGSGLLGPALFDGYRAFRPRPAAFFGVPVVRRPRAGCVTVAGGGLVASGAAGRDRLPLPWAPPGLRLTGLEGAGEVQTPLVGAAADRLSVGDRVWFRHAKSGELFEHVQQVHLVRGDVVEESVPSYRGCGQSW